jgi:hypothetical protein
MARDSCAWMDLFPHACGIFHTCISISLLIFPVTLFVQVVLLPIPWLGYQMIIFIHLASGLLRPSKFIFASTLFFSMLSFRVAISLWLRTIDFGHHLPSPPVHLLLQSPLAVHHCNLSGPPLSGVCFWLHLKP